MYLGTTLLYTRFLLSVIAIAETFANSAIEIIKQSRKTLVLAVLRLWYEMVHTTTILKQWHSPLLFPPMCMILWDTMHTTFKRKGRCNNLSWIVFTYLPSPNAVDSLAERPLVDKAKLERVSSNFNQVVDQCAEARKGIGRRKENDITKLDKHFQVVIKSPLVLQQNRRGRRIISGFCQDALYWSCFDAFVPKPAKSFQPHWLVVGIVVGYCCC